MKDRDGHCLNPSGGSHVARPRSLEARGITEEFLDALRANFEAEVERVDPGSLERTRRKMDEYMLENSDINPGSFQGDSGN